MIGRMVVTKTHPSIEYMYDRGFRPFLWSLEKSVFFSFLPFSFFFIFYQSLCVNFTAMRLCVLAPFGFRRLRSELRLSGRSRHTPA